MADTDLGDGLPTFEEEEFEIAVADENETQVDEATLKLQEEIQNLTKQNEELQKKFQTTTAEQTSASQLEKLAEVLQKQNSAPPESEVREPNFQEQYNKIVENVQKNYHSDPVKSVIDLTAPLFGQMEQKMNSAVSEQQKLTSKLLAMQSQDKSIMDSYGQEVEQLVQSLPPSNSVYQDAIARVKANHFDELLQAQVNAKLEEAIAQAGGQATVENPAEIEQKAPFTLANKPQAPASQMQKQRISITRQEEAFLKNYANNHMLDWNNPVHKATLVKKYKEGGVR